MEEKERVLDIIGRIPEALWPGYEFGIFRMDCSKDGSINSASNNDYAIALYDSAFRADDAKLTGYIAHEFAHIFWRNMKDDTAKKNYYVAAGWGVTKKGNTEYIWMERGKNYIYSDGWTSPEEDFANNIEAFLTEPQRLEALCPGIHFWIHEFFGDNFKLR
jgi:hypothetical protein